MSGHRLTVAALVAVLALAAGAFALGRASRSAPPRAPDSTAATVKVKALRAGRFKLATASVPKLAPPADTEGTPGPFTAPDTLSTGSVPTPTTTTPSTTTPSTSTTTTTTSPTTKTPS